MKEILKYQELDAKIRQLKSKVSNSESRKKAAAMQDYLKDSQNKIVELDARAGASAGRIRKLKETYDLLINKFNSLVAAEDTTSGDIIKLLEQIDKLERDISILQNGLVVINKDFEGLMKKAKTAKANLIFYKQEFENFKAENEPAIKEVEAELAKQKAKVKPELMAKYSAKLEGKIFPIFVPLRGGHCAGCRMEIPAGKLKDIDKGKYVECENCGRLVYIEE